MDSEPVRLTFASLKAGLDVRAAGQAVGIGEQAISTGLPALDAALGGGFPRGTLGTLEGGPSSGRTTLLVAVLAAGTLRANAAIIDDGALYPPAAREAGVRLERLLIAPASAPLDVVRCADILLRSRGFAVLAMPAVPLRAAHWSRLCALANKCGTLVLALGPQASTELGHFASTRVRCSIDRVLWDGTGVFGEVAGYELSARVLKHRRAAPGMLAKLRIEGLRRSA